MRVKREKSLRLGHEYAPNPISKSEIGESYENTGMAGLAARTVKDRGGLDRWVKTGWR
jgi:hypothetical protein